MSKKIILIILLFSAVISTKAQKVVSSGGDYQERSSGSLSWTIGEPVVGTVSNGNVITQGFQQSRLIIANISEVKNPQVKVLVFPNPTSEFLTVKLSEDQTYTMQLFNLNGQLLMEQKTKSTESKINMTIYTKGTYLLKLINNKESNTYQIIKQ